ncbi:MAG: hypothetical protein IJX01_00480 [Oscillospiraceae bacterium]|nr:hypothetical protein [Oscillospiraceae bacterium]
MAVKINFNICDNSLECSGIAVCNTGALYWDETAIDYWGNKGLLSVDNHKCISCGKCIGEDGCPVGAIVFATTTEELNAKTETLNIDEEQIRKLFVERYGAEPIDKAICISECELEAAIAENSGVVIVEHYADWSIQCLLNSIPIGSIVEMVGSLCDVKDMTFYKVDISESTGDKGNLPTLQIYSNGKLIATVNGYYEQQAEKELMALLEKQL